MMTPATAAAGPAGALRGADWRIIARRPPRPGTEGIPRTLWEAS